jgi:hypothetical protein
VLYRSIQKPWAISSLLVEKNSAKVRKFWFGPSINPRLIKSKTYHSFVSVQGFSYTMHLSLRWQLSIAMIDTIYSREPDLWIIGKIILGYMCPGGRVLRVDEIAPILLIRSLRWARLAEPTTCINSSNHSDLRVRLLRLRFGAGRCVRPCRDAIFTIFAKFATGRKRFLDNALTCVIRKSGTLVELDRRVDAVAALV